VTITEATPAELHDWDRHTVDIAGGNVYQSRAWAEQRARVGWRPRYLVFGDGYRLLSLERPWRLIGGSSAYLSRGPVSAGEPVQATAARLAEAADWLIARGVDVIATDAEIEASSGYGALIEEHGFRPIEEIQPSRHRMALALDRGGDEEGDNDEAAYFRAFGESTRQLIRQCEKAGARIVRWDTRVPTEGMGDGFEASPAARRSGDGAATAPTAAALNRFYDLMVATAARRHFALRGRRSFVDWSLAGIAAGHTVYLEALTRDGELIGGATFYRHGGRLTYSHSADRADVRRTYPGVPRLLLWRAIQIASREGMSEFDMAGVDVRGARREPVEGEEMFGLYTFKRSFGATWIELTGNHERVARPWRYALGRVTARLPGGGGG